MGIFRQATSTRFSTPTLPLFSRFSGFLLLLVLLLSDGVEEDTEDGNGGTDVALCGDRVLEHHDTGACIRKNKQPNHGGGKKTN